MSILGATNTMIRGESKMVIRDELITRKQLKMLEAYKLVFAYAIGALATGSLIATAFKDYLSVLIMVVCLLACAVALREVRVKLVEGYHAQQKGL